MQEFEDYQRLTSQGKLGEAGQKLEQHKRTLDELKRIKREESVAFSLRSRRQRKAWGEAQRNPRTSEFKNIHSPRSGRQR